MVPHEWFRISGSASAERFCCQRERLGVLPCVRTFANGHMKYTMRFECLWVARLIAFVADFQTCSSSCHQPPCHPRVFPQKAYVCSHCVVITPIGDGCQTQNEKNWLCCICLIVQKLVASGTKPFPPLVQNFSSKFSGSAFLWGRPF